MVKSFVIENNKNRGGVKLSFLITLMILCLVLSKHLVGGMMGHAEKGGCGVVATNVVLNRVSASKHGFEPR